METFTGYPFHLYTQIEDPSYIYIIGAWTSVTQHVEHWIPSDENQALLRSVRDLLDVEWMFHVDFEQMVFSPENEDGVIPLSAPMIAIERYFVDSGRKSEFQAAFEKRKKSTTDLTVPKPICDGWRLDREPHPDSGSAGQDEFVRFSGWRDVAHHSESVPTKEYEKHDGMQDCLLGFEIRHAARWEI